MDFVEICNVYIGKKIIKAAKRIFNSDKICRSYGDLNFGVTFFGTQCIIHDVLSKHTVSIRPTRHLHAYSFRRLPLHKLLKLYTDLLAHFFTSFL